MNVTPGWSFHSADFSIRASGVDYALGRVVLVRCAPDRDRWRSMSRRLQVGYKLYATGRGRTFEEALHHANQDALAARPIPEQTY